MKRRQILMVTGAGALAAAAGLGTALAKSARSTRLQVAEAMTLHDDDRMIGDPGAGITIIEYASLTCPHCASFHADTLPALKDSWIADGRARMVFRHYPLDSLALRAAALSECFEGDRFFGYIDLLFKTQESWARAKDPAEALRRLSRQAGMSDETFDSCFNNEATLDRILEKVLEARDDYQIQSTPSFVINGRKVEGVRSFADLDKILESVPTES